MDNINFTKLDAIRGIAAFYVCINHARGNFFEGVSRVIETHPKENWSLFEMLYFPSTQLTILGHEFVIIFFILSGFSIAYSVSRSTNVMKFYKRRIVRLYPPYLVGIFWAYLTYLLIKVFMPTWLDCGTGINTANQLCQVDMLDPIIIIKNLLYLKNGFILAPYWSLIYEVIFYALVPIFILKPRMYFISSIVLFIIHVIINGISYSDDNIVYAYLLHYNLYFAIGVFTFLYKDKIFTKKFLGLKKNIALALVIFLGCIGIKLLLGKYQIVSELISVVLSIQLMRLFLLHEFKTPILNYLGKISYTLYVTHFATLFFIKFLAAKFGGYDGHFIDNYFVWLVIPFICVLIADIFFRIAENPSKKLLESMRKSS